MTLIEGFEGGTPGEDLTSALVPSLLADAVKTVFSTTAHTGALSARLTGSTIPSPAQDYNAEFFLLAPPASSPIASLSTWFRIESVMTDGVGVGASVTLATFNDDLTVIGGGAVVGTYDYGPDAGQLVLDVVVGPELIRTPMGPVPFGDWLQIKIKPVSGLVTIYAANGALIGSANGDPAGPGTRERAYLSPRTHSVVVDVGLGETVMYIDDFEHDAGAATRMYPRDDGLGMSSAPRIHPRPKIQRLIGRYP